MQIVPKYAGFSKFLHMVESKCAVQNDKYHVYVKTHLQTASDVPKGNLYIVHTNQQTSHRSDNVLFFV